MLVSPHLLTSAPAHAIASCYQLHGKFGKGRPFIISMWEQRGTPAIQSPNDPFFHHPASPILKDLQRYKLSPSFPPGYDILKRVSAVNRGFIIRPIMFRRLCATFVYVYLSGLCDDRRQRRSIMQESMMMRGRPPSFVS
jgi:hypothetical protein